MGRSSFQLHNDLIVFPDPKGFIPDCWLEEDPKVKESTSKHWLRLAQPPGPILPEILS